MTRSQKLTVSLITYVPVILILAASVLYLVGQVNRLLENAGVVVSAELSHRFDREVKLGGVRLSPLGAAVFDRIEIAEAENLARGRLFSARQVIVRYNWRALLYGKGVQSIREVELVDLRLSVIRRKDGTFNILEFLKPPPGPPGPPFTGMVTVRGARVCFKDMLAKTQNVPALNCLDDVDATLDARGYPTYDFRLTGRGETGRAGAVKAVGVYNAQTRALDLDLNAEDLSARYWAGYLGTPEAVKVVGGKVTLAAGLHVTQVREQTRTSLTGYAKVADGSVLPPRTTQPIERINGTVAFAGTQAALNLSAVFAGSTAALTGIVSDFQNPKLNVLVTVPRLDYASLLNAVELPKGAVRPRFVGTGSAKVVVKGSLADPLVEVTASIPSASMQGYTAGGIFLSGAYRRDQAVLRSLRFNALGASVQAKGSVAFGAVPAISIRGRVDGLELSALPLPPDAGISGIADASFVIAGTPANPRITASATMPGGAVGGVRFGSLSGQFEIIGAKARIADLLVRDIAGGVFRASGRVALDALNVEVAVEGMELEKIAGVLGYPDIRGIGYFRGRVAGPIRDPTVSGSVEVFKGSYQDFHSEYSRAQFTGSARGATITDAVVHAMSAQLGFAGEVTRFDNGISFRGKARLERLRAEQLLSMLPMLRYYIDATGIIEGDFDGSVAFMMPPVGPLFAAHTGSGKVTWTDGSISGIPITTARAAFEIERSDLRLTDVVARSEDAELVLTGSADLDARTLDLKFDLANLDLARLRDSLGEYLLVGGVAGARGAVTGTWDDPSISATAGVDALSVNKNIFDNAELGFEYVHSLVTAVNAKLQQGAQVYTFDATGYDPLTNCLASGNARLTQVSAPDLWDMIRNSPFLASKDAEPLRNRLKSVPRLSSGLLNCTMQLSGCLSKPDGTLTLEARSVGIDIQQIDSITLEVAAVGGEVKLDRFLAVSEDLNIQAGGDPLYKDGVIQLELTVQNLDISRLRPWLGENTPSGVMSAEFVVEGDAAAPRVIGSVEVVAPAFRGLRFDRLRASTIEVESGRIQLSDIILAAGTHQAVAYGNLPWDWSTLSIPPAEPMELTAELDDQDLSMLGVFLQAIDQQRTNGAVQAQLRLAGTISEPRINGELTVKDGSVAVTNFTNQFDDVQVDLTFDGNNVVFNEMSALSSEGGVIGVEPGSEILIAGPAGAEAKILLFARGLIIGERNLLGYQEDVSLQLDAGLSVTGDLQTPLIADATVGGVPGGVTVSNARLVFAVPEEVPARRPVAFPIDPTFDVTLRLGEDVWIVPPSMSLLVTARSGTLLGSLSEPNLVLELEIQEGNISLAGTRLRVVPGGTINVTYAPPAPTVHVDLQAITSVMATSRLGRRERYEITVDVQGPVADLKIALSSRPAGLTREQMLAALGHMEGLFASAESGLQQDITSVLSAVGTSTLLAPIEAIFVERLGFEQFTVEYGAETPLSVYVSRRFFGNFYVSYFQTLGAGAATAQDINYQFMLSYRFKRLYELNASVDDQQTLTFEVGLTKSFN